ncbi:hypothetical protein EV2_042839 [Malus domestica]
MKGYIFLFNFGLEKDSTNSNSIRKNKPESLGTVWYADGTEKDGTGWNGTKWRFVLCLLRHRPPCNVVIILRATSTFFPPTHQTVSLSLSPTSLSKSGDSLGIYLPPSFHHDNFIGYKFLSFAPTWKFGSGSISLALVNLRFNYSFQIFRWNKSEVNPNHLDQDHNPLPGTAHLLATLDDELSFESGRVPNQIHLAYADGDDEMQVMFGTPDGAGEEEGLLL